MTMRRLDRKRLFEVEKLGKDVLADIGVGAAIKNAVVSATQHRLGNMLETDIVLDLGTSKAAILTGGNTASRACGESSGLAKLCTLATSTFGIVTEVRTVCLEPPTIDGTAYPEGFDLNIGNNGDATQGNPDGASPGVLGLAVNIGEAIGKDTVSPFDNTATINSKALYFSSGQNLTANVKATAALTGLDDHANITTGDKLTLFKADGTKVELLFDKALAHGTPQALKIGLNGLSGGGTGIQQAEASAKVAIEAVGGFTTAAADTDGSLVISQSAAGPAGNSATLGADKQNSVTKAAGSLAIAQFTGGTAQGLTATNTSATFTAGKFLIRITGFVVPDDLA